LGAYIGKESVDWTFRAVPRLVSIIFPERREKRSSLRTSASSLSFGNLRTKLNSSFILRPSCLWAGPGSL
jgi:hypothetical protein